jgi:glycogen synthase
MRVCIVTIAADGVGGMQDHTHDLAGGLLQAGHDVELLAPPARDGRTAVGFRWRPVDAPGHHMDRRWLERSYEVFAAAEREAPFDVVHSEGSSALELVRRNVHRRTPLVAMFHGNFLGLAKAGARRARSARRPVPVLKEMRAFVSLWADHFPHGNWYRFRECEAIVPSYQQVADTRRSHLLDRRRIHVVPNGVDADVFRPRNKDELRAQLDLAPGLLLVSVGRLNREKGVHHALAALARLSDENEAHLVIVGDGEERENLVELSERLGLAQRVRFTGALSKGDVARYLAASDVFLFPTERDEAAPLVLPQAMSSGLAVVASDIGGITEVFGGADSAGLLVEPGDVNELVAQIRRLSGDHVLRAKLGAAARQRVLAEYTTQRMTERTLAVYRVAQAR